MARIDSDKCMFPVSTSEGNVREGEGYRCGGQGSVRRSVGRYGAEGKGARLCDFCGDVARPRPVSLEWPIVQTNRRSSLFAAAPKSWGTAEGL